MEAAAAIGLVASVATLTKAAKAVFAIARQAPHASDSVRRFNDSALQIYLQAELVKQLSTDLSSFESHLFNSDLALVVGSIRETARSLEAVLKRVEKIAAGPDWKVRWKWILVNSTEAQAVMQDLLDIRTSMILTISILNAYGRDQDRLVMKRTSENVRLMVAQCSGLFTKSLEPTGDNPARFPPFGSFQSVSTKTNHRQLLGSPGWDGRSISWCRGALTWREQYRRTTYAVAAQVHLPLSRVMTMRLIWRTYCNDWLSFRILRGSCLSVVRFVADDHIFMEACRAGDLVIMRSLLDDCVGRPNDMTAGNRTPMCLAIESGSLEAVQMLVSYGADVDTVFGCYQTSPLAWSIHCGQLNIARALLFHGASCDHVSSLGWTPLFYIWSLATQRTESCTDLISMLASNTDFCLSHEGISDIEGFGVIHRAVIFGTANEVNMLLRVGVSPFAPVGPLLWTAIQNAVYYGRPEIFDLLLPWYQHMPIDVADPRGWTLLHISASAGQTNITRRLLRLGANPRARSKPSHTHMPEQLYGGSWTPAEVAKAQSEEKWLDTLRAIREVVGNDFLDEAEMEALEEDVWLEALEVQ